MYDEVPYTYGVKDSGSCGSDGENCGKVNIYDSVRIYSYGGAGGGASLTGSMDSGAGAGGYPAAGIGRWRRRPVAGGDHACSAGGFTAGVGEDGIIGGVNGLGSNDTIGSFLGCGAGGGYFSYGKTLNSVTSDYESWFGLGGCWTNHKESLGTLAKSWSTAGSGGTAGQGGIVRCSTASEIHAFNGNRITEDDFNYDDVSYEYDEDGTLLDGTTEDAVVARVVKFINDDSKKIIPTKIFIQDGIRRAVYDNLCYMSDARKEQYGVDGEISESKIKNQTTNGVVKCVRIVDRNENIPHSQQGIGSGAGYIELSNGTYTVDSLLN